MLIINRLKNFPSQAETFLLLIQPTDRTTTLHVSNLNLNKQERFMVLYQPQHARLSRFVQTLVWNKEEAIDYLLNKIKLVI